ncbi:MAG: Kae1-associated kinase Bud32, partial [Methanoregulaceae archaeon]
NRRLQEMMRSMCEERGAGFFVPGMKYLGDNGAMIAYTGKIMLESGYSQPLDAIQVNPSYRADQVEVTWRDDTPATARNPVTLDDMTEARGAEAVVTLREDDVVKQRVKKGYRQPGLDRRLIAERTRAEARLITVSRKAGVPTPVIRDVTQDTIVMERVRGVLLREVLDAGTLAKTGQTVGKLHSAGIVHGDLTTGNIIFRDGSCVLIDFGLAQFSQELEARGVDIHVLFQTLEGITDEYPGLIEAFCAGYEETFAGAHEVLLREQEIEKRGRYL